MSEVKSKIEKSREKWVTVGGHDFLIRRPSRTQVMLMAEENRRRKKSGAGEDVSLDQLLACVVDWKVPENQLFAGGGGTIPPFELEDLKEWLGDQPDLHNDIGSAVIKLIQEFEAKKDKVAKH
jgi:hypothetical protein